MSDKQYLYLTQDKLLYLLRKIEEKTISAGAADNIYVTVKQGTSHEGEILKVDEKGNLSLTSSIVDAAHVAYDNGVSEDIISRNVQGAINEIDTRVHSLEHQDKIDEAFEISYANTTSGMAATNLQQAVDEIDKRLDDWIMDASRVSYNGETLDSVIKKDIENLANITANKVGYSNLVSGYEVENTQEALDALYNEIKAIVLTNLAEGILYDNTNSKLIAENVQAAIDELIVKIDDESKELSGNIETINKELTERVETAEKGFSDLEKRFGEITENAGTALAVNFDDTKTELGATSVQTAIEALDTTLDSLLKDHNDLKDRLLAVEKISSGNKDSLDKLDIDTIKGFSMDEAGGLLWNSSPVAAQSTLPADKIIYSNTTSGLQSTEIQSAVDELDTLIKNNSKEVNTISSSVNTKLSEQDGKINNITSSIDEKLANVELPTAEEVTYSNSTSGLKATETQSAIDEVAKRVDTLEKVPVQTAATESYSNTASGLSATTTQAAIDEINSKVATSNVASNISFDNTNTGYSAKNVQDALDETKTLLESEMPTKAEQMEYDNELSGLDSTNTKTAIDELASMISKGEGKTTYVVKVKTFTYVGDDSNSHTISFENIPYLVKIIGYGSKNQRRTQTFLGFQEENAVVIYGGEDGSISAHSDYTYSLSASWSDNYTKVTLASSNSTRVLNRSDCTYHVVYFYRERTGGGSGGSGGGDATGTTFDDTSAGWKNKDDTLVDNVQDALDAVSREIKTLSTTTGKLKNSINVEYTSPYSSLTSKNVQDAIDELDNKFNSMDATEAKNVKYDNTSSGKDSTTVQNAIDRLYAIQDQLVEDYYYVYPKITKFYGNYDNTKTYEKGISIEDLHLYWEVNKTITDISLTGCTPAADGREIDVPISIIDTKTFILTVTDSRGNSDTATFTLTFGKNIYWGSGKLQDDINGYDLDFCLSLGHKEFVDKLQRTYDFMILSQEYGFIVYPFDLSVISRSFLDYYRCDAKYITTLQFTNESGFTYPYYVYRISEQTGLGKVVYEIQ